MEKILRTCSVLLIAGFLWSTQAQAVELAVPESFPASTGALDMVGYARYLTPVSQPDQVVVALDPRVKCVIEDGWLRIEFAADESDWPTLPLSTACTMGGGTLPIEVVAMSPEVDPSKQSWTLDSNNTATIPKITGSTGLWSFRLPPGSTYMTGEVPNTLAGNSCNVVDTGKDGFVVQIFSETDADLGTGACSLPRKGEPDFVLTLALSAHSI